MQIFTEERERFLPFRLPVILERAKKHPRLSPKEGEQLEELFEMIAARFHFEFHRLHSKLDDAYSPFDPDKDTQGERERTPEEIEKSHMDLTEGFHELLIQGNYTELSNEQLAECLNMQTFAGITVQVDLDNYKELKVYYRGVKKLIRKQRKWYRLFFAVKRPVMELSRVAILVHTQDDQILLKLFKDIIVEDLKIISPGVQIKMPVFARLKIGTTVAGGLFAPILKLAMAAVVSPIIFITILVGCIGAFIKGIISFLSTKTKYMQTLSSTLYFRSLANNTSAIARLVQAAEAEEVKEMLLAYFMLYVLRDRDLTEEELDGEIEAWLMDQFGLDIDFEVDDGVRKLREKGLLVPREVESEDGTKRTILKAYDIPSALRIMDECWDNMFTAANDGDESNDRVAEAGRPPLPESARDHSIRQAASVLDVGHFDYLLSSPSITPLMPRHIAGNIRLESPNRPAALPNFVSKYAPSTCDSNTTAATVLTTAALFEAKSSAIPTLSTETNEDDLEEDEVLLLDDVLAHGSIAPQNDVMRSEVAPAPGECPHCNAASVIAIGTLDEFGFHATLTSNDQSPEVDDRQAEITPEVEPIPESIEAAIGKPAVAVVTLATFDECEPIEIPGMVASPSTVDEQPAAIESAEQAIEPTSADEQATFVTPATDPVSLAPTPSESEYDLAPETPTSQDPAPLREVPLELEPVESTEPEPLSLSLNDLAPAEPTAPEPPPTIVEPQELEALKLSPMEPESLELAPVEPEPLELETYDLEPKQYEPLVPESSEQEPQATSPEQPKKSPALQLGGNRPKQQSRAVQSFCRQKQWRRPRRL